MGFNDIWKWLCGLPPLAEWSTSLLSTELCASQDNTRKLLLVVEKILAENNSSWFVKFSLILGGQWPPEYSRKTLWDSCPCPFEETSVEKRTLPLISQLLGELVHQAPNKVPDSTKMHEFTGPFSCKDLCNFLFVIRFFWVCACENPFEVGSLYFETLNDGITIFPPKQALNSLLLSLGLEHEVSLMRSLGYMYTKFLCLGSPPPFNSATYSFSMDRYCSLRAYAPVLTMKNSETLQMFKLPSTEDSLLQYILSHQQLEAVIQLKYETVVASDHIEVKVSLDNVRCRVYPLAFGRSSWLSEELYFPSKISVTVFPSEGSQVLMMSLNKSSYNPSTELASHKILQGDCYSKFPIHIKSISAIAACCTSEYVNSWRFEQRAEGHKGVLEWVLYDNARGMEVGSFKGGKNLLMDSRKKRLRKASRDFKREGGVVFGRDEYGESGLVWRLKRDCPEDVQSLKWNVGGCIWITYCPSTDGTDYCETRFMEIMEEVHLSLQ